VSIRAGPCGSQLYHKQITKKYEIKLLLGNPSTKYVKKSCLLILKNMTALKANCLLLF